MNKAIRQIFAGIIGIGLFVTSLLSWHLWNMNSTLCLVFAIFGLIVAITGITE